MMQAAWRVSTSWYRSSRDQSETTLWCLGRNRRPLRPQLEAGPSWRPSRSCTQRGWTRLASPSRSGWRQSALPGRSRPATAMRLPSRGGMRKVSWARTAMRRPCSPPLGLMAFLETSMLAGRTSQPRAVAAALQLGRGRSGRLTTARRPVAAALAARPGRKRWRCLRCLSAAIWTSSSWQATLPTREQARRATRARCAASTR
mmetsp:Transcript_146949/g.381925  ORF Transcript_146949/g.381925 Transcript_146949/m.381925 type:complete len:202 (+) Transcript_146949:575-1180(+)